MSERQIDDAIDAAVRDLMNVDADPALRARVVERLRRPAPRTFFWRQLLTAAAGIALLAAGLSLVRGIRTTPSQPATATSPSPSASSPRAASPDQVDGHRAPAPAAVESARLRPQAAPARATARSVTQTIPPGGIVATVTDEPVDAGLETAPEQSGSSKPLSSLTPIEVGAIVAEPIRTSEIVLAPLTPLSELVVAPLDPRTQRD
jgi:hypothetical protein